jgi:hypothetical protein
MTNATTPPAHKPKQNRLAMAIIPLIGFGIAAAFLIPQMCSQQREQELLEQGRPAVAEILSIRETGNLYNRKPEVEIQLRVKPAEGAEFSLEVTKVLSQTDLAKYVEGTLVEIRYDPADLDDVAFVKPVKPSAASAPAEGSAR